MPQNDRNFDSTLRQLARRLRYRAAIRLATWGVAIGVFVGAALFAWLWLDEASYLELSKWIEIAPEGVSLNLLVALAPVLLGLVLGASFGFARGVSARQAALWADHSQSSPNTAAAYLEFKGSRFADAAQARAMEVAAGASLSTFSSLKLGYHTLVAFLLLVLTVSAVLLKSSVTSREFLDEKMPKDPLLAMRTVVDLGRNAIEIADALNGGGRVEQELGQAFRDIEGLGRDLQDGNLSQADALARLGEIEERIGTSGLSETAQKALEAFGGNPELTESLKDIAGGDSEAIDRFLKGEEAKKIVEGLGGNTEGLRELLKSDAEPAKRARAGDIEGARAVSEASRLAKDEAEYLRRVIGGQETKAPDPKRRDEVLRKLREAREALKSGATNVAIVERKGIDTVLRDARFESRPTRLPPHLERALENMKR
ncbi:MAG: hypothetical protein KDB07_11155 [Planctomycetes bacterium]|nr:hypothetical protein [Planctomycetota bacterium]